MNRLVPESSFPEKPFPAAASSDARGIQPVTTLASVLSATKDSFIQELEQLARLAAFRPDLHMVVGKAGSDWHFNWRTGTISIDGGRLETESADFTRGLVLHESAHAAITRLEAIVPVTLLKDRRIFVLLNVVEDCRIETWMQLRFPGCRPWVREYNNRLFHPLFAAEDECPPAGQFLNGILTRWWYGKAAEPLTAGVHQALESVWPALEAVLKTLPRPPDSLGDLSVTYSRNPVSRCYTAMDICETPDDYERAIRMAQFEMWSIVHRDILPVYLRLLPPEDNLDKPLMCYFSRLLEAMPSHHLLSGLPAASLALTNRRAGKSSRSAVESPLAPTGRDSYLESSRRQHAAIELLSEALLRWFQVHGRTRYRHGCPWGSRLNLTAAMRFEADPRLYDQLWSRPLLPNQIDPHFSVVIDRSGSMRGKKIEHSFHGAVLLSEVCRRVGLPLSVYSFGSNAECLLHHDDPLSTSVCAKLGSLPNSAAGGTNLTAALEMVIKDIGAASFRDRFVFVISDGIPDDVESVRGLVTSLADDGVSVVGLGLGPETLQLRNLIPVSKANMTADELPSALATLLVRSFRGAG